MKFQGRLTDEAGREFDLLFVLEPAAEPPPPPELTLSLSDDQTTQVGQAVQVTFQASGGTPPYVYTVDWKDGSPVEGVVAGFAYHVFAEPDLYLVEVTAQDAAGGSVTDTIKVEVAALPDGGPALPGVVLAHVEEVTLAAGERLELPVARKNHPYLEGSFLVRFRPDVIPENNHAVVAGAHGSALQMPAFAIGVSGEGNFFGSGSLQLKDDAIRVQAAIGSTPAVPGVWRTVCVSWDPYVKKLYVDGSLEAVFYTDDTVQQITDEDYFQAYTGKPDTLPPDAPMPVVLGRQEWFNGAQGADFAGAVSHVLLATEPWTAEQIQTATEWAAGNEPEPDPLALAINPAPPTEAGQEVLLTWSASGGTDPYQYTVDWRDGSPLEGTHSTSARHAYATAGTYAALVTAQDQAGDVVVAQVDIVITEVKPPPPPPEPLAVTAVPTVTGLRVAWDVQVSGGTEPYDQVWLYGDGTSGTEPVHDYHHPNEYHAQLTVTDAAGAQAVLTSVVSPQGDPTPDPKPTPVSGYFVTHANEFVKDFGERPTLRSVRSGLASDPLTWDQSRLPRDGDVVAVGAGHKVVYDLLSDARLDTLAVKAGGRLDWMTTVPTRLRTTQLLVEELATVWVGAAGAPPSGHKAEMVFNDLAPDPTTDHARFGTGLLVFGGLYVYGDDKGECRVRLAADALAGQSQLTLAKPAPTGWSAGDRIDLPDTRQLPLGWQAEGYQWQGELATIAGISADRQTLLLTQPLQYSHKSGVNRRGRRIFPSVGHLTRNIVFRSENAAGTRAHAIFFDHAEVDLHWCAFTGMGRSTNAQPHSTVYREVDGKPVNEPVEIGTNQQGRYPLHFHHLGGRPGGVRGVVKGVVVSCPMEDHPFKWPIVLHGTQDFVVRKCHTYNWAGSQIVMEDAASVRNVIEDCYTLRGRGVHGWNMTARPNTNEPFDMAGAGTQQLAGGLWYIHPGNIVRNNVVANMLDPTYQVAGYVIMGRATVSWLDEIQGFANGVYEPFAEFSGNECHGVPVALSIWEVGSDGFNRHGVGRSVLKDFTFWHCHEVGLYAYGLNNFLFDGMVGIGDPSVAGGAAGIGGWEYLLADCTFRNLDFDGLGVGFVQTVVTEGVITVEDSYLDCNGENINIPSLYPRVAPDPDRAKSPRHTVLRNVKHGPTAAHTIKLEFTEAFGANYPGLDVIEVYAHDGVAGDDFRVYYRQQAPDYVMPPSVPRNEANQGTYGSPEPGLTNRQLWDKYGIAIAGAVLPANAAERGRIEGLTAPLT